MMVNTCKYNRILPPSSTRPSWSRIQSQLHPMDQYVIWNIPHMGPNIEAILEVTTSIHWETLLTQQDPPLECHRKNTFQIQLDNRISPVVSCKSSRMPEFLGFFLRFDASFGNCRSLHSILQSMEVLSLCLLHVVFTQNTFCWQKWKCEVENHQG